MSSLSGHVCLISGGGSGIGAGIAGKFAVEGASVAICGRRTEPLSLLAEKMRDQGGQVLAIPGDVSLEEDVERIVAQTQAAFGPITILVNNAGISGGQPIHDHGVERWDRILAVNLRGPFLLARAVLPGMRSMRSGHILQISSETSLRHYAGSGAYGVSKHALNALSEYIQKENQDYGIRVDTICPGMVVTEMTRGRPNLNEDLCLYPEDIAELAHFLVTRRANIKIGTPVLIQTMDNPWQK
ncbi:MAG: SDR family NAD(P)-dependent oxidoreductase [Anaerolineales bacterium]|nr:SDR family NAD(P)-dependent oxidoreductase [Anaerolineales bacterium]